MSEQTGQYKIEIKTTADTTGAKTTSAELDKVGQSAKSAGESLNIGLNPDAFNALGDAAHDSKGKVEGHGEAMKEGAKHAELFGEKHHEAHAAVKALGEVLPGVGQLAREMFNPATLAIGMLGLGLEMIMEHFKNLAEEEEAFTKSAAQGVGSMLLAQAGAAASAATEHQALADALAHAATGENSLLTAMSNRIALFDNYITGLKKVEAAEDAAEEARIKRAQREGKITPEQAEAGMTAIHGRAETRNAAHDDQAAQFKLDQETAALEKAQKDLLALAKAKEAADAKVRAAEAAQKSAETRAGEGKGSEAEQLYGEGGTKEKPAPGSIQARLNEKQAKLDRALDIESKPKTGVSGSIQDIKQVGQDLGLIPKVKETKPEVDALQQQRDQLLKAEESAKREAARKAVEAQAAKDEAEEANRKYTEAQSTVKQYGGFDGKVSVDAAKLQQDREARAQAAVIKNQSAAEDAAAMAADRAKLDPEAAALRSRAQNALDFSRGMEPGSRIAREEAQELKLLVAQMTAELERHTHFGLPDSQGLAPEIMELRTQVANLESIMAVRSPMY